MTIWWIVVLLYVIVGVLNDLLKSWVETLSKTVARFGSLVIPQELGATNSQTSKQQSLNKKTG